MSSAVESELDREWFRELEREDLSFEEEGEEEDDDEESSPRETLSNGMVAELGRGVAPIKGLRTEGTFSCSILFKDGRTAPWGGAPGPSDARRAEEDFVGVELFGVPVRSK